MHSWQMHSHETQELSHAFAMGIVVLHNNIVNFREAVLGLVNRFAFYLAPCSLVLKDRVFGKRVGIGLEVLVFVG